MAREVRYMYISSICQKCLFANVLRANSLSFLQVFKIYSYQFMFRSLLLYLRIGCSKIYFNIMLTGTLRPLFVVGLILFCLVISGFRRELLGCYDECRLVVTDVSLHPSVPYVIPKYR